MSTRCWIETPDGARLPVGAGGLLIGRGNDCDIVVAHNDVSRRHALVCATSDGAEVIPFGRNPTTVGGKVLSTPTRVDASTELVVPGLRMGLIVEVGSEVAAVSWVLAQDNTRFPVNRPRVTIGGGAADDLWLPGLPAEAAVVTVALTGLIVDGDLVAEGEEIAVGAFRFTVARAEDDGATTRMASGGLPRAVHLQFLPSGGRLTVTRAGTPVELYLPERRCALIATLLKPPPGYARDEFLPDDVVIPRVWSSGGDRTALNVLIARTRKRLTTAGLDGRMLLERAPTGGATRFRVAPDASVKIT